MNNVKQFVVFWIAEGVGKQSYMTEKLRARAMSFDTIEAAQKLKDKLSKLQESGATYQSRTVSNIASTF